MPYGPKFRRRRDENDDIVKLAIGQLGDNERTSFTLVDTTSFGESVPDKLVIIEGFSVWFEVKASKKAKISEGQKRFPALRFFVTDVNEVTLILRALLERKARISQLIKELEHDRKS